MAGTMAGQHLDPAGDCTGSLPLPKTSQIYCAFDPEYHRHLPGDSGRPLDLFPLGGEQECIIFSNQRMDQSAWFLFEMRRISLDSEGSKSGLIWNDFDLLGRNNCHSFRMAGSTGLEPAASGVTGQCCNQTQLRPHTGNWWAIQGSNL